jgi:hypothetical protein
MLAAVNMVPLLAPQPRINRSRTDQSVIADPSSKIDRCLGHLSTGHWIDLSMMWSMHR